MFSSDWVGVECGCRCAAARLVHLVLVLRVLSACFSFASAVPKMGTTCQIGAETKGSMAQSHKDEL